MREPNNLIVVLAARANGLSDRDGRDAAIACSRSYRNQMRSFSEMDVLETWYARLDEADYLAMLPQHQKVRSQQSCHQPPFGVR